jgi:hypothetical protein
MRDLRQDAQVDALTLEATSDALELGEELPLWMADVILAGHASGSWPCGLPMNISLSQSYDDDYVASTARLGSWEQMLGFGAASRSSTGTILCTESKSLAGGSYCSRSRTVLR